MLASLKLISPRRTSLTLLALGAYGLGGLGSSVDAADAATVIAAMDAEREKTGGWIMHVGTTDGQLEADLLKAKDGVFNVTGVALTDQAADTARRLLVEQGLAGEGHIHQSIDATVIPAKRHSLSALVVDLDATGITREEAELKVAPFGVGVFKINGAWETWNKPALEGADDWTHYDHGPDSNDASDDMLSGYSRGLQWIGGPYGSDGGLGARTTQGVVVHVASPGHTRSSSDISLYVRDAYNGSLLWQLEREGTRVRHAPAYRPDSRYAMFVDGQRLYLHLQTDEHMKSYDLFTGKDPMTYDQGFSLSEYEQSTWFRKGKPGGGRLARGEPARSLVSDGKLVQVYMHRIYVLDAKTGKRLWMHEDTSRTFNRPLVQGGKLVMLAGPQEETFRRSGNYKNDLEGFFTDQIIAFDLTTGEPAWAVDNPLARTLSIGP